MCRIMRERTLQDVFWSIVIQTMDYFINCTPQDPYLLFFSNLRLGLDPFFRSCSLICFHPQWLKVCNGNVDQCPPINGVEVQSIHHDKKGGRFKSHYLIRSEMHLPVHDSPQQNKVT